MFMFELGLFLFGTIAPQGFQLCFIYVCGCLLCYYGVQYDIVKKLFGIDRASTHQNNEVEEYVWRKRSTGRSKLFDEAYLKSILADHASDTCRWAARAKTNLMTIQCSVSTMFDSEDRLNKVCALRTLYSNLAMTKRTS